VSLKRKSEGPDHQGGLQSRDCRGRLGGACGRRFRPGLRSGYHGYQIVLYSPGDYDFDLAHKRWWLEHVKKREEKRLANGAEEFEEDYRDGGWTSAHDAAGRGDAETIRKLAAQEPDALFKCDLLGHTLAIAAAYGQHSAVIRTLGELAAETLGWDNHMNGEAPAHIAARNGDVATIRVLNELVPYTLQQTDEEGRTPAHYAANAGNEEMVRLLGKLAPSTLEQTDEDGRTLAHYAANAGNKEMVRLLGELAPSTFGRSDKFGCTPVHGAVRNGDVVMIRALAELNPPALSKAARGGATPAHLATDGATIRLLHELAPSTLSMVDNEGATPAHRAARKGNEEVIKVLEELVPSVFNTKDQWGRTPSVLALEEGNYEMGRRLGYA